MSTMRPTPDHPCPPNSNPENTSQQPAATKTKTQALDGPAPVCALPGKYPTRFSVQSEPYTHNSRQGYTVQIARLAVPDSFWFHPASDSQTQRIAFSTNMHSWLACRRAAPQALPPTSKSLLSIARLVFLPHRHIMSLCNHKPQQGLRGLA